MGQEGGSPGEMGWEAGVPKVVATRREIEKISQHFVMFRGENHYGKGQQAGVKVTGRGSRR